MRDEEIRKYIEKINQGDYSKTIFLRQISRHVDVARVWEQEPVMNDEINILVPSFRFFFIKNDDRKYVGAVLDMTHDLHWYVLEEARKKGYLTKALREAIIPYLFYDDRYERDVQRITISHGLGEENYKNSKAVAEKLGFRAIDPDQTVFELKNEEFDWKYENLEELDGNISTDRFLELRKRVILCYRQLVKISDELLMAYDDDRDLREVAHKVSYFNTRILNVESEYTNNN